MSLINKIKELQNQLQQVLNELESKPEDKLDAVLRRLDEIEKRIPYRLDYGLGNPDWAERIKPLEPYIYPRYATGTEFQTSLIYTPLYEIISEQEKKLNSCPKPGEWVKAEVKSGKWTPAGSCDK